LADLGEVLYMVDGDSALGNMVLIDLGIPVVMDLETGN
jgi:hypothetical protein